MDDWDESPCGKIPRVGCDFSPPRARRFDHWQDRKRAAGEESYQGHRGSFEQRRPDGAGRTQAIRVFYPGQPEVPDTVIFTIDGFTDTETKCRPR